MGLTTTPIGGGSAWGAITGTLSNQTDLQAALDAKVTAVGGSISNTTGLNADMFTALNTKVALTGDTMTGTLTIGATSSLLLGTAGSAVGNIGFRNATSGTATLAPPSGALGTYTVTLPGETSTLATLGANVFTAAQTVTLGTNSPTSVAALSLINSTAATVGVQSASPFILWTAQGWKTNATAGSQQVDFKAFLLPVQGTASPIATLQFQAAINGGAFANVFTLNNETGGTIASTGSSGNVLSLTSAYGTTMITRAGSTIGFNTAITTSGGFIDINSGGSSASQIYTRATAWIGLGVAAAVPVEQVFSGCDGLGSNITGGILNISGGRGTGTGISGVLNFRSHAAAASSSTVNASPVTVMQITSTTAITITDAVNFVLGTTTGTKWGASTSAKQSWWGVTPVVQPAHIADPTGGAVVDAEARTAINSILAWQATLGLTAAA